jgi:hypothetical protein
VQVRRQILWRLKERFKIVYQSGQFTSGEFFAAGLPAGILQMIVLTSAVWLIWPLMGMPAVVQNLEAASRGVNRTAVEHPHAASRRGVDEAQWINIATYSSSSLVSS